MKSSLLFNFSVDKENNTINIQRKFNAELELVWKAWTIPEILDQWWAPKPFQNKTKILDFKEGGMWHYAMVSPENKMHWNRFDYVRIEEQNMFSGWDGFCDEEANFVKTDFSKIHWKNSFIDNHESTTVDITLTLDTFEGLEKILKMGFKEGFTAGLNQLDNLLDTFKD